MPKAVWNGATLAESGETIMVEGNHYFPPESVDNSFFGDSSHRTRCHWKGDASYYDLVVNGQTYNDGAWYCPDPSQAASQIKDYVAFYGGVSIEP
jgi:uncharacterized protein (DUF427 family)